MSPRSLRLYLARGMNPRSLRLYSASRNKAGKLLDSVEIESAGR